MADEEEQILPKEEALALARRGREEWNKWAEENPGVGVDFSGHSFRGGEIDFSNFIFPGSCNFYRTKFIDVNFSGSTFSRGVNFNFAQFKGPSVSFQGAELLGGEVIFRHTKFSEGTFDFSAANFSAHSIDFSDAEFNGHSASFVNTSLQGSNIRFIGTKFKDTYAQFFEAKFSGQVSFARSVFSGEVTYFGNTVFRDGSVTFEKATFVKNSIFTNAGFENECSFESCIFNGPINFEESYFKEIPDFRRSAFFAHFTLHRMDVENSNIYVSKLLNIKFEQAKDVADADKFRRLKELAIHARDHDREQDFFAKELKAKRFYEINGLALCWSYCYEWFSDFGRSVSRPFFSLFITWLLWGIGYWYSTLQYLDFVNLFYLPIGKLHEALKLSLATIVPFFAISREEFHAAKTAIAGDNVSLLLDFAMVFEGILAVAFIFLIGLALRNRFRI